VSSIGNVLLPMAGKIDPLPRFIVGARSVEAVSASTALYFEFSVQ
jgi:hypothetical protein